MLRRAPGDAGTARDARRGRGAQSLFKDDCHRRVEQPRARALRLARLQIDLGNGFTVHLLRRKIYTARENRTTLIQ